MIPNNQNKNKKYLKKKEELWMKTFLSSNKLGCYTVMVYQYYTKYNKQKLYLDKKIEY